MKRTSGASADGRFVALPAEAGTVYIISDPLAPASAKSAEWIDRTSFQVEKVKTLEVRTPKGDAWRIARAADNADWKLAGAKPGEKLDVSRAKLRERLPREKLLSGYVLLVPRSKLEDTLKPRAELLEKKPGGKCAAAS